MASQFIMFCKSQLIFFFLKKRKLNPLSFSHPSLNLFQIKDADYAVSSVELV